MKKALFIGFVWPEPSTTAAGQRMLQLLFAFKGFGYHLTFASTATKTAHSHNLESLGIKTAAIKLNHVSFDAFVAELKPDIVVFDRFMVEEQFGWRVAAHAPNAIRILNTEDLHSLRKHREVCHRKGEVFTVKDWLDGDMTKREVASIYRSDLSLLTSTFEMELLHKRLKLPQEILMHLPFLLNGIDEEKVKSWPPFEQREGFITYGNGRHEPNVHSVMYLKKSVWPLLRKKLPNASLQVFGAYLPQQIQEMHNPSEGFLVLGWVEDLDKQIANSRVCLAPLRFGAGIKGKLVQAMQNGTPSVTTTVGAEGMLSGSKWPGSIAHSDEEFINSALALHNDQILWSKAQQRGVELINQGYSKTKWLPQLKVKLEWFQQNLTQHRSENYVGALLQHQTLASTKFMGKWIEEKNRK
ncbi:glycosyltransferase [Flagellimonas meishanensis]|uniref:glycosyltransferase n=1 Tax=Flagellimonas meishanensis TaxID=2873264 RepID=UPI001CA70B69|nr:glycosyltransferase [[Muricauda] meishanensis]